MSAGRNIWPSADNAIGTIMLAQWYANARLHFLVRMVAGVAVILVLSLFGNYALLDRPPQFRYVLTDPTGKVFPQVPLNLANHEDQYVVDWTVDAITRLYSFDFVNYRNQFQDAKRNMTTVGWQSFEEAMQKSGNFNAVLGNRYVTTAVPTGPGRVTKKGDVMGRHAWKVEFPMVIDYRSSARDRDGKPRATNQNLLMSVTVIRQPIYLNSSGLGIRAIVAE